MRRRPMYRLRRTLPDVWAWFRCHVLGRHRATLSTMTCKDCGTSDIIRSS